MWQTILGAIGAIVIAIFGFLFHKRGDKIKDLEASTERLETQDKINKEALDVINKGKEKLDEIAKTDESLDSLIDKFNSGDKL